jgi:beta-glucosidase
LLPHSTVGEMRDSATLELTGAQEELIEEVAKTGTPVVVIVISGRVHVLSSAVSHANAVLWMAPPGEEAGNGLADVLTGAVNPSGRLPVTFPRSVGQVPLHHDMRARGQRSDIWGDYVDLEVSPLFAFGHGLSYTTFAYEDFEVDAGSTTSVTTIRVHLTNTGDVAGEEIVQLYVRDVVSSVARPLRELIGFATVSLEPGAATDVAFTVDPSRLSFHDSSVTCVTEPGAFTFMVGPSSNDIRAKTTVDLSGEITPYPLPRRVPTTATHS